MEDMARWSKGPHIIGKLISPPYNFCPPSQSSKGFIIVKVKLLGGKEDGEIIEVRDTQIEQTDSIHEARVCQGCR
jgi:hypothetical protein